LLQLASVRFWINLFGLRTTNSVAELHSLVWLDGAFVGIAARQ
jgi:hypothetical protein